MLPEASSVKPEIVAVELVIIPDSSGFKALFMVNTGADSPSFFMVKVSSILEPKLAFVSVALSVVPKVHEIEFPLGDMSAGKILVCTLPYIPMNLVLSCPNCTSPLNSAVPVSGVVIVSQVMVALDVKSPVIGALEAVPARGTYRLVSTSAPVAHSFAEV